MNVANHRPFAYFGYHRLLKKVQSAWNKPRDPKRIDKLLKVIARVWKKNPDQRLGQLLVNAKIIHEQDSGEDRGRIFHYEDDQLLKAVQAYGRPPQKTKEARGTKGAKNSLGKREKGQVRERRRT